MARTILYLGRHGVFGPGKSHNACRLVGRIIMSVGSVGGSQVLQQIQNLQNITSDSINKKTDLALKLTILAQGQKADDRKVVQNLAAQAIAGLDVEV